MFSFSRQNVLFKFIYTALLDQSVKLMIYYYKTKFLSKKWKENLLQITRSQTCTIFRGKSYLSCCLVFVSIDLWFLCNDVSCPKAAGCPKFRPVGGGRPEKRGITVKICLFLPYICLQYIVWNMFQGNNNWLGISHQNNYVVQDCY